jgi:DNA modification methylase
VTVQFLQGDCRDVLKTLPDESVHCVVTSPPYWGLRDYGHEDQIGLDSTPQQFIAALVGVFREVKRVLRKDGTLWLNLGDCYNSIGHKKSNSGYGSTGLAGGIAQEHTPLRKENTDTNLKHKDLCMIPARVAIALQADGWWLRQDIIWHKPNPMPESVTDRCTKAHEYIFLLAKSKRYYFDAAAIAEPAEGWNGSTFDGERDLAVRPTTGRGPRGKSWAERKAAGEPMRHGLAGAAACGAGGFATTETRNKRSVWTVTTKPFKGAHFATFPPDLIEPCILAGCPEGGTVLDPFGGAGTTGLVAQRHNRNAILCELNPEYIVMAEARLEADVAKRAKDLF